MENQETSFPWIREYENALRRDPLDPIDPLDHNWAAYNVMRRHEEAIAACKKVVELSHQFISNWPQPIA